MTGLDVFDVWATYVDMRIGAITISSASIAGTIYLDEFFAYWAGGPAPSYFPILRVSGTDLRIAGAAVRVE